MTTRFSKNTQRIAILAIAVIGALLAAFILASPRQTAAGDEHEHGAHAEHDHDGDGEKGPHGGRLFAKDGYGLEVTIFEQGVEPEFRIYTYRDGKPLDPSASSVTLTLERLGRPPQTFTFAKQQDYLKGDAVVEEPHSFAVRIDARHEGRDYQFGYEQAEGRIAMSDAQARQNGVEVRTAGPARIASSLQLLGEVRFNEDRTVHIVPQLAGRVESVAVNAGDRVRRGQLMAVMSSQALADQRSELLAAEQRYALAKTTYERERRLWQEKVSAEQDYLQAQRDMQEAQIAVQGARQKLASIGAASGSGKLTRYEIRAPLDGTVTDKRIAVGQAIKDDAEIFVVADLSSVWVELAVPARDVIAVHGGQKATVKATAFDASADGTVSYVGALVGEQTRTATARIVLPNPKGIWRPGLPVTVELVADEAEVPVAVAADAVQDVGEGKAVYGRYGEYFEARPLKLGRSDGRNVEVLDGLQAGEKYAATNSFLIKADIGKAGASHEH